LLIGKFRDRVIIGYSPYHGKSEEKMNIYVGNLSYTTTEDDLRQAFGNFGEVTSAALIKDKFTGKSRGFGFVEMPSQEEAMAAIQGMNGAELGGRVLTVNEARPRSEERRGGGGRGGERRGGGERHGGGGRGYDDRGGSGRRDDW
jgi:RNA recognition motif-containing protein